MGFSIGGTDNLTWLDQHFLQVSSNLSLVLSPLSCIAFVQLSFPPGAPLILAASWLHSESNWPSCSWTTPGGQVWKIEGGLVVDEQGSEVEGVQVWEGEDQEVCGVRIVLCSEVRIVLRGDPCVQNIYLKDHRGRWLVKTQLADGRQLALSLETEDDVGRPIVQLSNFFQVSEGLRLPQDFEPLSYDIGLVPELFPSTSTHKQRSERRTRTCPGSGEPH